MRYKKKIRKNCIISSFQSHAYAYRIDCIRTYIMFARATALSSSRFSTTSTLGSSFSPSLRRARRHHQQNGRKDCVKTKAAVEPATKISFDDTSNSLTLLGTGVREKKIAILNVKVYAVAMYADKSKLTSDLLNGDFEKEILIQLNMKVEASDFFKALEEALIPRISRIATDMATKEDDEGNFMTTTAEFSEECEDLALKEMELIRNGLSGAKKLEKGTKVRFTFKELGGDVAMVMESSGVETTFKSYELAKALLDVYVGDDPISVEAKKAFEAGAAR